MITKSLVEPVSGYGTVNSAKIIAQPKIERQKTVFHGMLIGLTAGVWSLYQLNSSQPSLFKF